MAINNLQGLNAQWPSFLFFPLAKTVPKASCHSGSMPPYDFNYSKKVKSGSTKKLYYKKNTTPKFSNFYYFRIHGNDAHVLNWLNSVLFVWTLAVVNVTAFQCTWVLSVSISYCFQFFFKPCFVSQISSQYPFGFSFDIVIGFSFTYGWWLDYCKAAIDTVVAIKVICSFQIRMEKFPFIWKMNYSHTYKSKLCNCSTKNQKSINQKNS